jgi:hypothetical protein
MKKAIVCLFICLFALFFGCTPAQVGRMIIPPKPEGTGSLLKTGELIDKKISFLNELLEKKDVSETDKKMASRLLRAYESLKEASQRSSWASPAYLTEEEYTALFEGLNLLEEDYIPGEQGGVRDYSKPIDLYAAKRKELLAAYLSGDFKGVIDQCIELKRVFGTNALTPDVAVFFALSLAQEGMLKDAIDIGEAVDRELDESPDLIFLRARIAEWKLKLGQREDAVHVYERLTDTLDEQKAVVRSLSKKIAETSTGHEAVEETVNQLLHEVDQLVHERRFDEAKDLLVRKNDEVLPGPDKEAIDQALKSLEVTREIYLEEKLSKISWRKSILELARKQMEEEKFEEAISNLEALEPEQENGHEISELKERAIDGLVNRERNRAAKIYLEAKKSWDPEKKEKLLRSSYEILKSLIEKYPSSSLNQKLKSHLNTVGEELNKLGITDM